MSALRLSVFLLLIFLKTITQVVFFHSVPNSTGSTSFFIYMIVLINPSIELVIFFISIGLIKNIPNLDLSFSKISELYSNSHIVELCFISLILVSFLFGIIKITHPNQSILINQIDVTEFIKYLRIVISQIKFFIFYFLIEKKDLKVLLFLIILGLFNLILELNIG